MGLRFFDKFKYRWKQAKTQDQLKTFLDSVTCEVDLIRNPTYIVNNIFKDVKKIAVDGVSIGDSADSISKEIIKEIQKSSWPGTFFYHCTNNVTYKVISDMVVDIFLNQELVVKTGLVTEKDVLRFFGKPNKIKKIRNGPILLLRIFIYKKRHLAIVVDLKGEVARIEIFIK